MPQLEHVAMQDKARTPCQLDNKPQYETCKWPSRGISEWYREMRSDCVYHADMNGKKNPVEFTTPCCAINQPVTADKRKEM